jgi:sucrose-6-phosphate hydrolase SacC (GH32 family)
VRPVIANGRAAHWTGKWMNPGGVVVIDGAFHMFLNAFQNWPGEISIGHFVSENGYEWDPAQEDPVFTSNAVPYLEADRGIDVSSAVVLPDGSLALYFHTISEGANTGIGMATAPGPEGPWTFSDAPILAKGAGNRWDNGALAWPNVVVGPDGLVMYYTGVSVTGRSAIGMATSSDGYTWTKYNDTATTEAQFADSDSVLSGADSYTGGSTDRPRAQYTPEGWVMIYTGSDLNDRGLAFSDDGIHWQDYASNPIISAPDYSRFGSNTWDTNLVYYDGVFYYYMEIGSLNNTQIFLATHEGSLVN